MSEVLLSVGGRSVITARLESDKVHGRNWGSQPVLYLGMQLQLLPAGEQKQINYTLVRLGGRLQTQALGEFASFEVEPLALVPNVQPFFRQQDIFVPLDRTRLEHFENARAGNDARLQVNISALVSSPGDPTFEVARPSSGQLEVIVPRSLWIDNVLSHWNLSKTKVIEITFSDCATGEKFRNAYARIEQAEKHLASGEYKQTLTTLRMAFEGLAKDSGFPSAGKDFFDSLFVTVHPDKKEKARDALNGIYRFMHLGPHEQSSQPNSNGDPVVNRQDARFALILAQAAFGYMTGVQ
ncbi:MAG: hypothetical protein WAN14_12775 [Candidatus Acidiferrales bacterium]